MRKFVQYDKTTGAINSTTSGKMYKDKNNKPKVDIPIEDDMPPNIGIIEIAPTDSIIGKRVNITNPQNPYIEDEPVSDYQQFKRDWPYYRIIEHITDPTKREALIIAANDIDISKINEQ
jgi:hypothetical protein